MSEERLKLEQAIYKLLISVLIEDREVRENILRLTWENDDKPVITMQNIDGSGFRVTVLVETITKGTSET